LEEVAKDLSSRIYKGGSVRDGIHLGYEREERGSYLLAPNP
jgi:hypothetical protein